MLADTHPRTAAYINAQSSRKVQDEMMDLALELRGRGRGDASVLAAVSEGEHEDHSEY